MGRKIVFLHIGTPKTGTSAIQSFLYKNRKALGEKGIGYYNPEHRYNPWMGRSNADYLLYTVLSEMGVDSFCRYKELLENECERFKDYCSYNENLILSEEGFWGQGLNYEGFMQVLKLKILELCGPDSVIEIIVYLRRQDKWVFSCWKEDIRSIAGSSEGFIQSVEAYKNKGSLDYEKLLCKVAEVFGENHITVRSYDRCRYEEGGAIGDFLDTVGVKNYDGLNFTKGKVSRAFSMNATEALRLIKLGKVKYDGPWSDILSVMWNMCEFVEVKDNSYPMSYQERKTFLEGYATGNRLIEEKYLNGEKLFSDELEEYDVWETNPERDTKNAESVVKLANHYHEMKQRKQ